MSQMREILKEVYLLIFKETTKSKKNRKKSWKTSIVQYATHIAMYVYVLG